MLLMIPAQGCTRSNRKPRRCRRVFRGGGIEQNAGNHSGAKAVGFEKQVAVLGDVDFVHAFAFVGFVGFDESGGDRIPSDGLSGGTSTLSPARRGRSRDAASVCESWFAMQWKSVRLKSVLSSPLNWHGGKPTCLAMSRTWSAVR